MKNINWKNITKGVSVGLLLLALFVVKDRIVNAYTPIFGQTELERNNRFLGQSGNARSDQAGILDIAQFELAPKSQDVSVNLPGISLMDKGFLGNNLPVLFRQYGTAIFDNIAAYGDTAVEYLNAGFSTIQPETPGSAKLKVNGSIKIESFADGDPYDSRLRPVCHNDAGILSIDCGVIDETPPNVNLYSCESNGTWLQTNFLVPPCPAQTYSPGSTYTSSDDVCSNTVPSNATCTADTPPLAAQCGSVNGTTVTTQPSTNLCAVGTASSVFATPGAPGFPTTYTWTCTNSVSTANCSASTASTPIIGQCGLSDGGTFSSTPSNGLCSSGTASIVTGGGNPFTPYSWTCNGSGGGSNDSCSANYQSAAVNGQCGPADGQNHSTTPTSNLCSTGSPSSVTDNGPFNQPRFTWTCNGSGGGSNDSCQSYVNYCGSASGQTYDEISDMNPTRLCVAPAPDPSLLSLGPVSGGQVTWDCTANGQTNNCSATITGSTGGSTGGGGGGGSCGDSCTSNSDCQSGIFCYIGQCDMYDTNNNGQPDDFDGIC